MAVENLLQDNEYIPRRARSRNSNARPKIRMFSADQWTRQNFILAPGELAFDDTAKRFKIGDGETPWNSLEYLFIDITGNTQGLMTVTQFTEYAALFEASLLAYQDEITVQVSGFQVQLDGFVESVDNLQTQFQEVLDNNVDLSALISTETFNTYVAGQNTVNADYANRLQTLEGQNQADLSGYASQEWVTAQISNINVNIDLSSYATKTELQALNNAVGENDNILAGQIADLQQQINNIQVGAVDLTQVNSDIAAVNTRIDQLITDLQNGVYGTGGGDGGGDAVTYDANYTVSHYGKTQSILVVAQSKGTILTQFAMESGRTQVVFRLLVNSYFYVANSTLRLKTTGGAVVQEVANTTTTSQTMIIYQTNLPDGEYVLEIENHKTDAAQTYEVETWYQ